MTTRIEMAPETLGDFERILEHLAEYEAEDPERRLDFIIDAINVLESNPRIGRPVQNDKRELVIGRRAKGYVALYRYVEPIDTVFVLAIRSQREAGYVANKR